MDHHSIMDSITINATVLKIWDVLTNPDKIVLYMGSQTLTDWAVGSSIAWEGEMHGAKYHNKGEVLENIPNRLLRFTYWSGMGGDADLLENYSEITYTLNPVDENWVELTYSRIKIPTTLEKQIFEEHLPSMLEEIKRISEK
jgi:uncharacterized protein YndB with AHSA1/START domain